MHWVRRFSIPHIGSLILPEANSIGDLNMLRQNFKATTTGLKDPINQAFCRALFLNSPYNSTHPIRSL